MMPKPAILKLSAIVGSYLLAACLAFAAIPQFKVQDEETLSGAVRSIQEAFNTNESNVTIVLPAKEKRHPWSGFFALSSVMFACFGTGGLIWMLFGKTPETESVEFQPRGILPPSIAAQTPVDSKPAGSSWSASLETEILETRTTQLQPRSFEERRQQLFDKLRHSPQSWVLQLLEATPILIGGEPRSGKTELAQFIALLRVLFVKHEVEVNDPQGHLNAWAPCFPVYGSNFNYTAIDLRLRDYQERLTQTPQYPVTTIWEDCLQYPYHCSSQRTEAFNLIKSTATEALKKEEFAILVSQERPQQVSEEVQNLLENYFVQIHLFAERSSTGRALPSGRGLLRGLTKDIYGMPEQSEIHLPEWMQVRVLLETFPELQSIPSAVKHSHSSPPRDLYPRAPEGIRDADRTPRTDTSAIDSLSPTDSAPFARTRPETTSFQAATTSRPPSQRLQTIAQFIRYKQQGLNKEETIYKIWRIVKSASQQWEDASIMHDRMFDEYRDFIEDRRSLDELDRFV
ncbi:hypothetical protein [Oscillatoria sp. FACHB-1406]|uniref:hypothetical protein n=1 Tax=Oscillatoria sp. FACHB-1406 TaxID=2692846 RepID=UPI0016821B5B|nr:hypothetical protein [Oscillatoria sp. FACHB-1406]MBD2580303.1 hypothetical protein [Oscillatoria sp. FACHB-1406]